MSTIKEIGFWDYSCPRHGSLERYRNADWDVLLDDMAEGGLNSLVLCPKWMTTGYKSRLPWLDQEECTAIETDNEVLFYGLSEAKKRGIRCSLLVVSTQFVAKNYGVPPLTDSLWGEYGCYDLDFPGLQERMLEMYDEIHDLFGSYVDRYICELEYCDYTAPHRIPPYEAWAKQYNEPEYKDITGITNLQPRWYPFFTWRRYTTWCRANALNAVRDLLHRKGFTGPFATIAEVCNRDQVMIGNTDFAMMQEKVADLEMVTYDSIYNRKINRDAAMDFCIPNPRKHGYKTVHWLTRGVMTFDKTDNLNEQWDMSIEDALRYQPDTLWFMGTDTTTDTGEVCSRAKLPAWGYTDGIVARRALIKKLKDAFALKSL